MARARDIDYAATAVRKGGRYFRKAGPADRSEGVPMKIIATTSSVLLIAVLWGCSPTEPTEPTEPIGAPGDIPLSSADKARGGVPGRNLFYPSADR